MKMLGDDIFIQRGETFTLDFELKDAEGRPFCIPLKWKHPYLVITVSSSLYDQKGNYKETIWLDLNDKEKPFKRFSHTTALYVEPYADNKDKPFAISEILSTYGNLIKFDGSDYDIKNYLFCTDPEGDGKLVYKYVKAYTLDDKNGDGIIDADEVNIDDEDWTTYDCRFVIDDFDTREWVEQKYFYDANLVCGTTVEEYLKNVYEQENPDSSVDLSNDEKIRNTIKLIKDPTQREYIKKVFELNRPLMPDYAAKKCVWLPKKIFVSVNLEGEIIPNGKE
jgi:hypothetical protein